ncbi:MAG TPA: L-seryl-tRNA(Sec) selenium transferase [Candidatus Acidoferrales bacterium]|nr:L-seryl-tRNA(Sec) selenium transferase [Candidatus Acidoferrales bacterium]
MPPREHDSGALLRSLPSLDELLRRPVLEELAARAGRPIVLEAARAVLDRLRAEISRGAVPAEGHLEAEALEAAIRDEAARDTSFSLRAVINATGVVLHTNLGRAPIGAAALARLAEAASGYSNLEYDLAAGARGKRDVHTARPLARVLGAEAALVVNNNAAAVFLALHALARGGEVLVSRGELIEIGDGFRIPDIMASSGAVLREVGTTNRTHLADYEAALGSETRLLMSVHPSNFRIVGFAGRVALADLVELGRRAGVPVYEDLGSGCLVDLAPYGLDEPLAQASIAAGADVVTFSGDKLLGGPQAGIIAGRRALLDRIRRNPLYRALRVDKLTIAALEATLSAVLRGALDEIPTLRMIRVSAAEIERRAQAFVAALAARLPTDEAEIEVVPGQSVVGGGSTPAQHLPTFLVRLSTLRLSAAEIEARLRRPGAGATPAIARIEDDRLVLDLRTVDPGEESALAETLLAALR